MTFEEYQRQAHCGQWDFDSVLRSLYDSHLEIEGLQEEVRRLNRQLDGKSVLIDCESNARESILSREKVHSKVEECGDDLLRKIEVLCRLAPIAEPGDDFDDGIYHRLCADFNLGSEAQWGDEVRTLLPQLAKALKGK